MTLPPKAIVLGIGGSFPTAGKPFYGVSRIAHQGGMEWCNPGMTMGLSPYLEYAWIANEEPDEEARHAIASQCHQDGPQSVEAPFVETNPADPYGVPQHEPGAKNDNGKMMASLILGFPRALWAIGAVATYGAKKYTRDGWSHVPDAETRYEDAEMRHLLLGAMEKNDQESGLPHAWHHAWNVLATLELQLRKQEDGPEEKS